MKGLLLQWALLSSVVAAAVLIGEGPTLRAWGAAGRSSMLAAAAICCGAALLAMTLVSLAAQSSPEWLGTAVLGGMVARLVLTGAGAVAYQALAEVHLRSFLVWMTVLYLSLLAAETGISVWLVNRYWRAGPTAARR